MYSMIYYKYVFLFTLFFFDISTIQKCLNRLFRILFLMQSFHKCISLVKVSFHLNYEMAMVLYYQIRGLEKKEQNKKIEGLLIFFH